MSCIRRTSLLLSALFLFSTLAAQGQVTLILTQPPPNQLRISDLWRVDLINSGRETVKVYLHGVATEARDGLIVDATSSSFMLPPGRLSVTGPTLEPIDVNESHPRYRDIVLRTGTVPTGEYEICVYVLAVENDQELGSDCISISVERLTPPILISPSDESAIEEPLPLFTWTPPVPLTQTTRGVTYTIRIAEILGRQSAYDALQSNPAFYEKSGLPTSTLQFPSAARAFQSEKRYAWRVTAIRDGVEIGESEVWSFTRSKPELILNDQLSADDVGIVKNNDLKAVLLGLKAERVVGGKGSSGALVASGKKQNDGDMATFSSGLQYTDATLWTWGNNEYGELGTGAVPVPSRAAPTQVTGLTGMRALAIGAEHTLAVDPSGNIATWGGNDFGQLGVGNENPSNTPKWVAAFVNTLGVAAGNYHSVAIKGDGTVWTWGYNRSGELGLGDLVDRNTPKSTGLSGVIAVAAGDGHTLALKSDGTVWAWGTNRYGQAIPAFNADPVITRPQQVEGLSNVKAIAAGSNFSMALLGNGTVKTWGSNNSGQLGNGAADPDAALVYTFIISGIGGVDAKRKTTGGRFLSDAARPGVAPETPVIGTLKGREAAEGTKRMGGGVEMAAGSFGGYTIDKKAELGYIIVNLTGINTVTGLSNAIAIDAGGAHAIALRSDSTAWTWGNNYWGTLGTGDEAFHGGPTRVVGLTGIESIAAGGDHTFAVQRDGTVMAWGNNMHKQLGMDDVPASIGSEGEYSPSPLIVPRN